MRQRVEVMASPAKSSTAPAALIAAISVLIIFFCIPARAGAEEDSTVMAIRGDAAAPINPAFLDRPLASDSVTDSDGTVFSAPLPAPHYHDRYRFYHRYDSYTGRSRLAPPPALPADDGMD